MNGLGGNGCGKLIVFFVEINFFFFFFFFF